VVDFTNVLRAAFTRTDPRSEKKHCWLDCLFKRLVNMLVKLVPGQVKKMNEKLNYRTWCDRESLRAYLWHRGSSRRAWRTRHRSQCSARAWRWTARPRACPCWRRAWTRRRRRRTWRPGWSGYPCSSRRRRRTCRQSEQICRHHCPYVSMRSIAFPMHL